VIEVYTSFAFTAHLIEAGIDASIGTVGDALDNALMESTIGLYKTELIKKKGPWKTLADVELATAGYVDWYNNRRLHTAIGGIPPAEHETVYSTTLKTSPRRRLDPTTEASTKPGAVHGVQGRWLGRVGERIRQGHVPGVECLDLAVEDIRTFRWCADVGEAAQCRLPLRCALEARRARDQRAEVPRVVDAAAPRPSAALPAPHREQT
jgi:hypothetical protein